MNKNLQHISRVEDFLSKLLTKGKVSTNIFPSMPAVLDSAWEDFVLIDVVRVKDRDSHGEASVNIFLYARPTGANLVKNVKKLNKMENALTAVVGGIENDVDGDYEIIQNYHDSGYDETINFHFNMVNISITI
jgi:hypothetical protein